jgi:hypothetical protein
MFVVGVLVRFQGILVERVIVLAAVVAIVFVNRATQR